MLKVGQIFFIGPFKCEVRQSECKHCWFSTYPNWQELARYLGTTHIGSYVQDNLRDLDLSIKYYTFEHCDSPDFEDLKSLEKFIDLINMHIIAKQIEEKILN